MHGRTFWPLIWVQEVAGMRHLNTVRKTVARMRRGRDERAGWRLSGSRWVHERSVSRPLVANGHRDVTLVRTLEKVLHWKIMAQKLEIDNKGWVGGNTQHWLLYIVKIQKKKRWVNSRLCTQRVEAASGIKIRGGWVSHVTLALLLNTKTWLYPNFIPPLVKNRIGDSLQKFWKYYCGLFFTDQRRFLRECQPPVHLHVQAYRQCSIWNFPSASLLSILVAWLCQFRRLYDIF